MFKNIFNYLAKDVRGEDGFDFNLKRYFLGAEEDSKLAETELEVAPLEKRGGLLTQRVVTLAGTFGLAAAAVVTTPLWVAIPAAAVCYPASKYLGGMAGDAVNSAIKKMEKNDPSL